MEEVGCPRCKTTKYRNPLLKLMVNACGHSLCENCVDMLFIKGSGACPECGTMLRRNNYRLQVFEDPWVEKEISIRKKVLRDYNKKEEDFETLREYNDYLEMIELIISNLVNGTDLDATHKMIEQYRKENKDFIKKNQNKKSRDQEYLDELIEQEKQAAAEKRLQIAKQEQSEKMRKQKHKDALIDDLMFSDQSAKEILASHKHSTATAMEEEAQPSVSVANTFSTGIKIGQQCVFTNEGQVEKSKPYQYSPLHLDSYGPVYPTMNSIMNKGYLSNVRSANDYEVAGGFQSQMACQRALQDSRCGLFHFPPLQQSFSSSPAPSSSSSSQLEKHSPMCVS